MRPPGPPLEIDARMRRIITWLWYSSIPAGESRSRSNSWTLLSMLDSGIDMESLRRFSRCLVGSRGRHVEPCHGRSGLGSPLGQLLQQLARIGPLCRLSAQEMGEPKARLKSPPEVEVEASVSLERRQLQLQMCHQIHKWQLLQSAHIPLLHQKTLQSLENALQRVDS